MKLKEVLRHFDVVSMQGEKTAKCYCPAHAEANPSLTITEGEDGRIHLNCEEGCTEEAILKAVGLTEQDLFDDDRHSDDREPWVEKMIREQIEPVIEAPPDNDKDKGKKLKIVTSEELDRMDLKPVEMIVDGMIPVGLTLVVAPPKYGKSWMMLQMCLSVAEGTDFLGRKTNQCEVLYLPLEDGYSRLKDRQAKILGGKDAPKNFYISNEAEDMGNGLFDQLEEILKEHPDIKMIVIDTLQKIRTGTGRGENVYAADYKDLSEIKRFADEHRIAIVVVHHTRKMQDPTDPFANISGSNGISGATDTMIVLSRDKRDDDSTRMSITGRDVEEEDFQIEFNQTSCCWELIGTIKQYEELMERNTYNENPIVQAIKTFLSEEKEWRGSSKDFIEESLKHGIIIGATSTKVGKDLDKLAKQLYKNDNIVYIPIDNGNGGRKHRFFYSNSAVKPLEKKDNGPSLYQMEVKDFLEECNDMVAEEDIGSPLPDEEDNDPLTDDENNIM